MSLNIFQNNFSTYIVSETLPAAELNVPFLFVYLLFLNKKKSLITYLNKMLCSETFKINKLQLIFLFPFIKQRLFLFLRNVVTKIELTFK